MSISHSSSGSKRSSSATPPSDSDMKRGKDILNDHLRSIVMSRTAFTLFHLFNHCPDSVFVIADLLKDDSFTRHKSPEIHHKATYQEILRKSVRGRQRETDITDEMTRLLREASTEKFTVTSEVELKGGSLHQGPRIDIAWESSDSVASKLVGLVEMGFACSGDDGRQLDIIFWKKVSQALDYLDLLQDEDIKACTRERKGLVWEGPLLLCVLVANRTWTLGRLAIFVCEPKKANKGWRMALLWRKEMEDLESMSNAFGCYASVVEYLVQEGGRLEETDEVWQYLGPNCSRVTLKEEKQVRVSSACCSGQFFIFSVELLDVISTCAFTFDAGFRAEGIRQSCATNESVTLSLQRMGKATKYHEMCSQRKR